MQKSILAVGFLLLACIFPFKAAAENVNEIYVFGDSYSDDGNYYNYTTSLLGTGLPPQPYYKGRLTNGLVWVEYLAQDLGLKSNPSTNFAVAGATSGLDNVIAPSSSSSLYLTGVLSQISNFTANNRSLNPEALYIVAGGFNDLFFSNGTIDPNQPVKNILTVVCSLSAVGAKNILVANLPNLGDLPGTSNSRISKQLNDSTAKYNATLAISLYSLKQQLKTVNIVFLDVNSLFKQISANPKKYGFSDTSNSCLGNSVVTALPPSSISSICSTNPDQVFFWDSIHPTTTGHKVIAKYASSILEYFESNDDSTFLHGTHRVWQTYRGNNRPVQKLMFNSARRSILHKFSDKSNPLLLLSQ